MTFGRSLTNNKNNNGPRLEPGGTPKTVRNLLETLPLSYQNCLSFKYSLTNTHILLDILN